MTQTDQEERFKSSLVLLVEDDIQVLSIIRSLLIGLGFEKIHTGNDGSEAMKLIQSHTYDLVVCDWSLPRYSGLAVLEKFRKKQEKTPFMMVTGMAYEDAVRKAIACGVTAYVTKPFQINEMEQKITKVMS